MNQFFKKGRGAQSSVNNKFHEYTYEREYSDIDMEEVLDAKKTSFISVYPKTIVNKVTSPDVGLGYSMNPYQGCEHGCIYCYARNSHEYWGYGAGIDFESKILIKRNAVELLSKHLENPNWQARTIMLSGNTDCYQPIERKEKITRSLLKTFYKFRHPVGIITKNALIQRDLDILVDLKQHNLVSTILSITSLREDIRRKLEPRTSSVTQKLKTIERLRLKGIPVQLMMGPIIPGLTDHEIFDVVKAAADHGAQNMVFTMVRLNGHIGGIFTKWIYQAFPSKAEKVLSLIKQVHNGKLNDSRWGIRKRGEGKHADIIHKQIKLAKDTFMKDRVSPSLNTTLHQYYKSNQLNLFH